MRKTVASETWTPLDMATETASQKAMAQHYIPALQKFAGPESGCYINEVRFLPRLIGLLHTEC